MIKNNFIIRTRFAPSPTGEMHIGNLRAAIFCWLFAKQHNGEFLLRIEDTDTERSERIYENYIIEALNWLGLKPDLYQNQLFIRQSERTEKYRDVAKELYKKNFAYYCQCEGEINNCYCIDFNYTKGVLRFNVPKNVILKYHDNNFGDLECNSSQIENFALLKSNEYPTYHLSVVVDDHEMEITHVIRGEDHKTNTFKQILIYNALNWKIPEFTHLPIIKGIDGKKLSKRNGNTSIRYFIEKGFLPKAVFNILLKTGWGYKDEEIISLERALEIFSFNGLKKHPAVFEEKKLYNFSGKYLKLSVIEDFLEYIKKYTKYQLNDNIISKIKILYPKLIQKYNLFSEVLDQILFLFQDNININNILKLGINSFSELEIYSRNNHKVIRQILTGNENGLPIEILLEICKDKIIF